MWRAKQKLPRLRVLSAAKRVREVLSSIDAKIVRHPECAKMFEAVLHHINTELGRKKR